MSCCFHFFHPSFISPTSGQCHISSVHPLRTHCCRTHTFRSCFRLDTFPILVGHDLGHFVVGHIYLDTLLSDKFIGTCSTTVSESRRTWTHRSTARCSTSSRLVQGRVEAVSLFSAGVSRYNLLGDGCIYTKRKRCRVKMAW